MNPTVRIIIKDYGTVTMELYPGQAPDSVAAFIHMARQGVYDNQPIMRIVPGFVIQPSYRDFGNDTARVSIDGEFDANGRENPVPLSRGTVALAGDGKSVSSASCFFLGAQ